MNPKVVIRGPKGQSIWTETLHGAGAEPVWPRNEKPLKIDLWQGENNKIRVAVYDDWEKEWKDIGEREFTADELTKNKTREQKYWVIKHENKDAGYIDLDSRYIAPPVTSNEAQRT